jgi:hypothetical protein
MIHTQWLPRSRSGRHALTTRQVRAATLDASLFVPYGMAGRCLPFVLVQLAGAD